LQGLPEDPTFKRPEQPPLERDSAWWDAHGFGPAPKRGVRPRKGRAKR
jgi:hypothetical protein